MLAQQDLHDQAIDLIVRAEQGDRAHLVGGLAEPVHAALPLLVAGRVPGQVVVDDGLKVVLQVDAFGQAVGGDQYPAAVLLGQRGDARDTLGRWQRSGHDGDVGGPLEGLCEVRAHVLGGGDEAAEHDGVESVGQQTFDDLRQLGEFRVVFRAVQVVGLLGHAQQAAHFRVGLGAGGDVHAL